MSYTEQGTTSFDHLPTVTFEHILDNLNDQDIAAFHLVSRTIFKRVYEYIRHGRETSRKDRDRCIRFNYPVNPETHSSEAKLAREEYIRQFYVNLKPRFYQLIIYVGRVLPKEARILFDAYQSSMQYCIWRKIWEDEEDTHFEQLSFNFEELQKFYRKNYSFRMLFDSRNSQSYYSITSRQSDIDVSGLARQRANHIRKKLTSRPYDSLPSLRCIKI